MLIERVYDIITFIIGILGKIYKLFC